MSNYKTVFFTLGILQIILGISMLIPILTQIIYSEIDSSFIGASIISIIVDPVVVIPDILSKKESVIDNSRVEKIKGKDPNIAIVNQESAVSKKACWRFNFLSWFKLDKKNNTPNIIEIIDAPMNEESISEYIIWVKIGITIDIPRIICKIPKVKKTVL